MFAGQCQALTDSCDTCDFTTCDFTRAGRTVQSSHIHCGCIHHGYDLSFAAVALGLTVVGVTLVVSRSVMTLVLRSGVAPVVAGIAIGVMGSLAAERFIREFLYSVVARDPVVYAGVAAALIVAAVVRRWCRHSRCCERRLLRARFK